MKTVLITGAAGRVGCFLRRELAGRYRLRLSDVRVVDDLVKGERFTKANLARPADAVRIARGVDAIVHLGGYSVEGPWPAILEANIVGSYNLFEAARRVGVPRVVFASSHHVVGFHRRVFKRPGVLTGFLRYPCLYGHREYREGTSPGARATHGDHLEP